MLIIINYRPRPEVFLIKAEEGIQRANSFLWSWHTFLHIQAFAAVLQKGLSMFIFDKQIKTQLLPNFVNAKLACRVGIQRPKCVQVILFNDISCA